MCFLFYFVELEDVFNLSIIFVWNAFLSLGIAFGVFTAGIFINFYKIGFKSDFYCIWSILYCLGKAQLKVYINFEN